MTLPEQEIVTVEATQCVVLLSTCRTGTLATRGSDANVSHSAFLSYAVASSRGE
jgi:hypothetical protein